MNYESATDKELEIRLTSLIYNLDGWEISPMGTMFFHCGIDGSGFYEQSVINYCTDWNATMPLAVEHGLDIELPTEWLGNHGTITKNIEFGTDIYVDFTSDDSPLRAIVICLIKVLESK